MLKTFNLITLNFSICKLLYHRQMVVKLEMRLQAESLNKNEISVPLSAHGTQFCAKIGAPQQFRSCSKFSPQGHGARLFSEARI